ncbi:MAG: 5-formyltetrahydrofolate cyclo-ligase [Candidatus Omnitrophica bacterium]|nr:5-formyltetrahydrofolate cyclo-ligase [Candidatus Omnitrophota bacterium]
METKEVIRKETIRRLQDQDPHLREERSLSIQKKLLSNEGFEVARTVMIYVSLPTEVNTGYFIKKALERGKKVVVPYIEPNSNTIIATELKTIEDLEKGPLGIYQPKEGLKDKIPIGEIDLLVVPAIAYDKSNMRLGRGKGYYDRFLSRVELNSVKTIGVAFNFQIIDYLPRDPHDKPVSLVITD